MAIIIPSSKIYDKQNPKVRDNVIERIEVSAKEIVPDNEYETPVYNEKFENVFSIGVNQNDTDIKVDGYGYIAYISYVEAIPQYANIENFDVAILKNNHYIEKLLLGKDKNGNPNINISFIGNIYRGKATQQRTSSTSSGTNVQEVVYQEPTYKENGVRYELPELTISNTVDSGNGLYVATASVYVNNETNLVNLTAKKITIQNIEYFRIESLKVLCGLKFAKIGKILSFTNPDNFGTYTLEGEYEDYVPTQIEITIYGNKIGIDLVDKTVYINGETQKKVHSIDGNELMQTANYVADPAPNKVQLYLEKGLGLAGNGYAILANPNRELELNSTLYYGGESGLVSEYGLEGNQVVIIVKEGGAFYNRIGGTIDCYLNSLPEKNQIEDFFQKTAEQYKQGKETATIRCSIGDYYDYESGAKVISLDNSTKKMSFALYDEVVPMVYGADGKDKPMSYVGEKAKVFQVMGTNVYYDGAVWQELSLQEVVTEIPEEPIVEPLTAPTISIDGDILTMTETDERTEQFVILVDGVETATVEAQNLISFTISGTQYQAVSGMTWGEWVDSEYNTDGYVWNNNGIICNADNTQSVYYGEGGVVMNHQTIENGRSYLHGKYVGAPPGNN